MSTDEIPADETDLARSLFTTRQAAHALGITKGQLIGMGLRSEAHPAYRLPGSRGAFMWTRTEIVRLLALSDRRTFRRRRVAVNYQMNGLQPVHPRPIRRPLPPPPKGHT